MVDVDTFLTTLYVIVDDFCKTSLPVETHPGPDAALTRSEVVTLAIFGQWQGFGSERGFYRYARRHLRAAFPTLPAREQCNRQVRQQYAALVACFLHLVQLLAAQRCPYEALDSSGIPTRDAKRRGAGWLPGLADIGWSNRLGWYEGFPLLLAVNPSGVITGFRVSPGGAQVRYGVTPDLTTFGKIVAGGMPGAAVAGKAEIMDMMAFRGDPTWDNRRRIGQGGTFNANPPTAVAGITALHLIATEPMNQRADALAERLKAGLNTAFQRTGIPGHAYGVASMVNPVLGVDDHCDRRYYDLTYDGRRQAMTPLRCSALTKAMLTQGVHVMGGQVFMVSAVHTEAQIDRTIDAFEHALHDLRAEGIV